MKQVLALSDLQTWVETGEETLKNSRLMKIDFLYPPNDEINKLITFLPRGDSTKLEIDAIVNAANSGLHAGGGICGMIHDAAGRELAEECEAIGGCQTGGAALTKGYNLPSKYVIHAVGPVGENPEALRSAYQSTLDLMDGTNIRSVGLCCISTGIYGYSIHKATPVALDTVRQFLEIEDNRKKVDRIIFVVYLSKDVAVYQRLLHAYFPLANFDYDTFFQEVAGEFECEEEEEDLPISFYDSDLDEGDESTPDASDFIPIIGPIPNEDNKQETPPPPPAEPLGQPIEGDKAKL